MKHLVALGGPVALATILLAGCSSTVTNYGLNTHFSASEFLSGSTSTPAQCADTMDAVWVEGADYHECIRYFPSAAFASGHVDRAIVFLEGDKDGAAKVNPDYVEGTPAHLIALAGAEQKRDNGLAYVIVGRPGTDGSSGNQHATKRTHYEAEVIAAAVEKIKQKYGIKEFALVGQSGGGGLVADLVAERHDVLCAVSSSGVTSVVSRAKEKGLGADIDTKTPFSQVWDPIDQLSRVQPMAGFRMFVVSDPTDNAVSFTSQQHYVEAAQKAGLPIHQLQVHASGEEHHVNGSIANRIAQACMAGLPTDYIVKTFMGMYNKDANKQAVVSAAQGQRGEAGDTAAD